MSLPLRKSSGSGEHRPATADEEWGEVYHTLSKRLVRILRILDQEFGVFSAFLDKNELGQPTGRKVQNRILKSSIPLWPPGA